MVSVEVLFKLQVEVDDYTLIFGDSRQVLVGTVNKESKLCIIDAENTREIDLTVGFGHVRDIKVSQERDLVGVLKGPKLIEIYHNNGLLWDLTLDSVCSDAILGFEWIHDDNLMLVHSKGIDFYTKNGMIVKKRLSFSIAWYKYLAEKHLLLICWNNQLQVYHLQSHQMLMQLPNIEPPKKSLHLTFCLHKRNVGLITLYNIAYLIILEPQEQTTLFLYRLSKRESHLEYQITVGSGLKYLWNVVDDCLLLHNLEDRMSYVVDVNHLQNIRTSSLFDQLNLMTEANAIVSNNMIMIDGILYHIRLEIADLCNLLRTCRHDYDISSFQDLIKCYHPFFQEELEILKFIFRRQQPELSHQFFLDCLMHSFLLTSYSVEVLVDERMEWVIDQLKPFLVIYNERMTQEQFVERVGRPILQKTSFMFVTRIVLLYSTVVDELDLCLSHFLFELVQSMGTSMVEQFIQHKFICDAPKIAQFLLEDRELHQQGTEMLKRISLPKLILEEWIQTNEIHLALHHVLEHDLPVESLLEAAYKSKDPTLFCTIYQSLKDHGRVIGDYFESIYRESWSTMVTMTMLENV